MNRSIINTAIFILNQELKRPNVEILKELKTEGYPFDESFLSRAPDILFKNDEWISRNYQLGTARLRKLQEGLIQILDSRYRIKLVETPGGKTFQNQQTGQKWGLLKNVDELNNSQNPGMSLRMQPKIDFTNVLDLMKTASEVWILQTYLSSLDQLDTSIKAAIEHNPDCKIKILLLDPNHEAAHLREKGLSNKKHEQVIEKIRINIGEMMALKAQFPSNIEFALYDAIPGFAMYRVDSHLFIGFQWFHKFNREGTFLEMPYDTKSHFVRDIEEHWTGLWEYAKEYRDEQRFKVKFNCYFEYEDAIKEMQLMIDTQTKDVSLLNTPSTKIYYGNLINLRKGYCCIHLVSDDPLRTTQNVAFFMINIDYDEIGETELATGIYCINSPVDDDRVYARKVLLENQAQSSKATEAEKNATKELYLKKSVLINEQFAIKTWSRLIRELQSDINNTENETRRIE